MGLFWDLQQQSQLSARARQAESADERIAQLEQEVTRVASLLHQVIGRLEQHVGTDLDGDGRIGR